MPFDHERLEVYQGALDFFDLADQVVEQLPRGRGHLADQLTRASLSMGGDPLPAEFDRDAAPA